MIFEKILAKLKVYGVITDSNDEFNINTLIDNTKIEITTYCNFKDYPEDNLQLDNILVNLVVLYFLKSKNMTFFNSQNGEESSSNTASNEIKSISVGDFSVSYDSGSSSSNKSVTTAQNLDAEIEKYYLMLNKFRRILW